MNVLEKRGRGIMRTAYQLFSMKILAILLCYCTVISGAEKPVISVGEDMSAFVYEPLKREIRVENGQLLEAIGADVQDASLTVDSGKGVLKWQPDISDSGSHTFTFSASNSKDTVHEQFSITVRVPHIQEDTLRILQPNGGGVYGSNDTIVVMWIQNLDVSAEALLKVSADMGLSYCTKSASSIKPGMFLNSPTDSIGVYWLDRDVFSTICYYRVVIADIEDRAECVDTLEGTKMQLCIEDEYAGYNGVQDCSDDLFTIRGSDLHSRRSLGAGMSHADMVVEKSVSGVRIIPAGLVQPLSVTVFDYAGNACYQTATDNSAIYIPFSALARGTYIVQVKGQKIEKIVPFFHY